jgi:hypothetical protein
MAERPLELKCCYVTKSRKPIPYPPLDPDIADMAPADPELTACDHKHLVTYPRLLDADAEGADWEEVARIVLHIDPLTGRIGHDMH